MDKKRLIFIIIFTIAVAGIGFAMYWVFLRTPETARPTGNGAGGQTNLPTGGTGQFTNEGTVTGGNGDGTTTSGGGTGTVTLPSTGLRETNHVITDTILDPKITQSGNVTYYNTVDGKFYTTVNGEAVELSNQVFFNVENVIWSNSSNESIIEYPDGSNIYYNFDTKVQTTLPKYWEDFSFSEQGDQIVAKSVGLSPENRWLVTSDANGENVNFIEPMGENADKVIVDWSPNKQIIGLSLTGDAVGADRQEVLFIGQNGENFKSIIVEGRGFQSMWSPTGNKLLYSVYSTRSQYKPELWMVDTNMGNIGANRKMLNVNTWADKCVFYDERIIYCAVANNLPVGSGFVPELATTATYTIVKIDSQTGLQTSIFVDTPSDVKSIFISEDKKTLYYTDRYLPGLFSFEL
jgi:hypothetical protein